MVKKLLDNWLFIVLSVLFLFVSLSFIVTNGTYRCSPGGTECGLYIGSWHMHDALWHLSLIRLSFKQYPFTHPFMAGEVLHGYNYGLDLVMYSLNRLGFDPLFLFFRFMPAIAAVLYVYAVSRFVRASYPANKNARNIMAFLLYFGNSMSYFASLYQTHNFDYATLKGFPVVTSLQPVTMFLNLQYAFSLSLLIFLILLCRKPASVKNAILIGCVIFLLFALKFYAGAVGLIYLSFVCFPRLRNNTIRVLSGVIGAGVSWFIFYRGGGQGFPFAFSPFALTHLMIDDPLLFFNHTLTLGRYYLYENGGWTSPRLWLIEILSICLFALINFGVRLIGFASLTLKSRRTIPVAYYLIPLITFFIPIFFVQKGGWYNTMQFLYYGVWFAGLLTGTLCVSIKNKIWQTLCIVLVVILSLPNTIEQITYMRAPQSVIGSDELAAMRILAAAPAGVVHISQPHKKNALVPALGGHYPYYLDTDQLMVTGVKYQEKLDLIQKYSGGSITSIPARYYLIYKQDEGSNDSLRNMDVPTMYRVLYDSDTMRLYEHI